MSGFERSLQRSALRYLNEQHHTVARCNSAGPGHINGDPDVYGCVRGLMFHIELKQPEGRLTEAQRYRIDEWRSVGARVYVAHNMDEVRDAWADVANDAADYVLL